MQASFAYISTLRRAFDDKGVTFAAVDLESVLPAIARYSWPQTQFAAVCLARMS